MTGIFILCDTTVNLFLALFVIHYGFQLSSPLLDDLERYGIGKAESNRLQ